MIHGSTWDLVLLVVAGYVAVTLFVRLMRSHRDQVVTELQREWTAAQQSKQSESQRERRRQLEQQRLATVEERRKRRQEGEAA